MTIFNVFSLLGGLALFLFGMDIMGKALEKQAGGQLQKILSKLTDNPLKGFFLGLCVTAVIQSSSATTVMVVGFVNSGIMELHQAIGVIMGSNVGTTVTSWILSLSGLQGDSLLINLLKPTSFSPLLAFIGILLYMCKSEKKKGVGTILIGFAVLMTGMTTMSNAVLPLQGEEWFTSLFVRFSNPILGVLVGALVTGIIQSSSASVGILQALSATGVITYGHMPLMVTRACPLQNIHDCAHCDKTGELTDRKAKKFPVRCGLGVRTIYNPVPIYMGDKPGALTVDYGVAYFTLESREEAAAILDSIRQHAPFEGEFTRGLYFKGTN